MAVIYAKNKTTGEWERVSPETAVIDPTLSIEGSPADAKATGDALEEIRNQIDNISDNISFDGLATEEYVDGKFDEVSGQVSTKQDALTFDTTPTEGSTNPVTSEGIKAYVDSKEFVLPEGYPINNGANITWDGDVTDKLYLSISGNAGSIEYYKVSDRIFSNEELKAGTATYIESDGTVKTVVFADVWTVFESANAISEEITLLGEVLVLRDVSASEYETIFVNGAPETGTYFPKMGNEYTASFITGTITTMSPTLLPSDIAYKPYVDEQLSTQLATKQNTLTITDDGNGHVVIS